MAAAAVVACCGVADAAERAFRAEYVVSLFGLPIAQANFDSTFDNRRFSINGTVSSSGLARLFDKTTGTTRVAGVIDRNGATPRTFQSAYQSGDKSSRTTIRFDGRKVVKTSNTPRRRTLPKDWVGIPKAQLAAALDPISASLVRANSASEVCDRTVRIFDGEMRADLKLTHRATGTMPGFDGEAVTCDARLVPVAGYRKGNKQIAYLAKESRVSITFVRLADTGFYTPADASVGTQIGTVRITARKIEAR
jgi:hypothetical protein